MAPTRRRKHRTHVRTEPDPAKKGPPKSFVFWRGRYGLVLRSLEADLRKLMQPHTANNLKESHKNQLKDFISIAGPLGVSQFLILTATEQSCYLRLAKIPRGPTLTMRIHSYSLVRDLASAQARPRLPEHIWKTPPLVVMSGFTGEEHLKLAAALFQNMFPAINVQSAKLSSCQRVVLLSFDKETNLIKLRHYSIRAQPSGVTKAVKQLIARRQIPDLGNFQDVTEFLTKSGYGSESEGEEAASSRVTLAQNLGRGNLASRQSRVILQEIGPRLDLEILKEEEGVCAGKVLYHRFIQKSPEEAAAQAAAISTREELREKRRKQQEENVRRKSELTKRKREADSGGPGTEKGAKKKKKEWWEEELEASKRPAEEVSDAEYYRQEVGEEPDELYTSKAIGTTRIGRGSFKRRGSADSEKHGLKTAGRRESKAGKREEKGRSHKAAPGSLSKPNFPSRRSDKAMRGAGKFRGSKRK